MNQQQQQMEDEIIWFDLVDKWKKKNKKKKGWDNFFLVIK